MCEACIKKRDVYGVKTLKKCDNLAIYKLTAKRTQTRGGKHIVINVCGIHMRSLTLKDEAGLKWQVEVIHNEN